MLTLPMLLMQPISTTLSSRAWSAATPAHITMLQFLLVRMQAESQIVAFDEIVDKVTANLIIDGHVDALPDGTFHEVSDA